MIFLGIDPGLKGGFAFILEDGSVELHPMPLIGKKDYDIPEIVRIIRKYKGAIAVLEKQHAMPGQGLTSTLKTGLGFGILQAALCAGAINHSIVPAIRWQKNLFVGLPAKQDTKVSSEIVAKRLFPEADFRKSDRARVASDGLTDATCIAEYCRRNYTGPRTGTISAKIEKHIPSKHMPTICERCGCDIPTADEECINNFFKENFL